MRFRFLLTAVLASATGVLIAADPPPAADEASTIEKIPAGPVLSKPLPDLDPPQEVPNTEVPVPSAPALKSPTPPEPPAEPAPETPPPFVPAPIPPMAISGAPVVASPLLAPVPAPGCACGRGAAIPHLAYGFVPGVPAAYGSGWAASDGPAAFAGGGLHNRYPYYSYRRPWYSPGPSSVNVTILW